MYMFWQNEIVLKIFMCLLFFTGWLLQYLWGYWLERNTSYLFCMQRKPLTYVIISYMQFFFFYLFSFFSVFLISCFILFPNNFSYCMKFHTFQVPTYWVCEPCKSKSESASQREEDEGISSRTSKMHQSGKAVEVESLSEDEVVRLPPASASKHASCPLSKGENFSQPFLPSLFFYFLLTFIYMFLFSKTEF